MAEEEIIPEVKQQPPQLPKKKEEKKKPGIQLKQLQKKQQPPQLPQKKEEKKKPEIQPKQPQQIKIDEGKEKGKPTLSKEDKELLGKFETKYGFDWRDKRAGYVDTVVGDDIIFIRRIPNKGKGYAKYKKSGQYLIVKTNIEKFNKFKNNETKEGMVDDKEVEGIVDDDEEEEKVDDIKFEYFNFSKEYFDKNENIFADSLKQKKFLFDELDKEKKEVKYFGWNDFKDLDIIPGINDKEKYIDTLEKFKVEEIKKNNFGENDLFGIADEEPIEEPFEERPLPKKEEDEDVKIEDDIEDDIPEINVQDLQPDNQQQQQQQNLVAQNNQLINAGHTPNGKELRALIKYNNNSDSLLKLIVSLSENNKGEVDFKEIGEIQDLNGDITDLYTDMQKLKSKINSSNNAEEKERLLIKYNKKRLKLEDLIKKYSKEAYRLSTLKKKKATMATHKYLMNKLNKL